MIAQTKFGGKRLDFSENSCHGHIFTRNSVLVNTRNNVRACGDSLCDKPHMLTGVFSRLCDAIEDDERSYTKISEEAGLGQNYVQQMVKNKKMPTIDRLEKILSVMPENVATFVVLGHSLTKEDLEFLRLVRSVPDDFRSDLRGLVSRFSDLK